MASIKVIKLPKKCPRCGGTLVEVSGKEATYVCEDCRQRVKIISFPKNAKRLALKALKDNDYTIFDRVHYEGIYRNMMVFIPGVPDEICWDGYVVVFVKQDGKAIIRTGLEVTRFYEMKQEQKDILEASFQKTERFYRIAAKRCLQAYESALEEDEEEGYYRDVRRRGTYKGQRVYVPLLKPEFIAELPQIGIYPYIFVDNKGKATLKRCLGYSYEKKKWQFYELR